MGIRQRKLRLSQVKGLINVDTFDSVGLVVIGFAILVRRRAGGLTKPLLRLDAHVDLLLLSSALPLGHPRPRRVLVKVASYSAGAVWEGRG